MRRLVMMMAAVTWGSAFAANLTSPYRLDNTQVLPEGVRNPRFLNVYMSMDSRFGADGDLEPLGSRLNKRVSWADVLASQEDEYQRNLIRSVLADNSLSLEGSPGSATGTVNTFVDVKAPILAWGVSPRHTLALVVPVYRVDVSVDTAFERSGDGQRFINAVCENSPEKCNEAARKLNEATRQKLQRLGYAPLQSETISALGDMRVVSKYQWWEDPENAITTRFEVTLPTGTGMNADKALDIPTGDGRFQLGALVMYDRRLFLGSLWNVYGGYTAQLPHSVVRRLPVSAADSLSADKEELTRTWGGRVTVGSNYTFPIADYGISLTAGYSFEYQTASHYEGAAQGAATRARYALLRDLEPEQSLHSLVTEMAFSTVDWYRAKRFPLPLQTKVVYSRPLAGRNVPSTDVIAGELVLFF